MGKYLIDSLILKTTTAWKVSKYGVFSGPYFSAFGQNTEIYLVNHRIQSEYRKIGPEKLRIWTLFTQWTLRRFLTNWRNNALIFLNFVSWLFCSSCYAMQWYFSCLKRFGWSTFMFSWLYLKQTKERVNARVNELIIKLNK